MATRARSGKHPRSKASEQGWEFVNSLEGELKTFGEDVLREISQAVVRPRAGRGKSLEAGPTLEKVQEVSWAKSRRFEKERARLKGLRVPAGCSKEVSFAKDVNGRCIPIFTKKARVADVTRA